MYRFYINNVDNDYHYSELIRVFMSDDDFEVITITRNDFDNLPLSINSFVVNKTMSDDRDTIKKELYFLLQHITGMTSDWGTLTGVRPLKLAFEIYHSLGDYDLTKDVLKEKYLISEKKINLLIQILKYQLGHIFGKPSDKVGIYIGIPFCPTRCSYCSFAANVAPEDDIKEYFNNLIKEIEYIGSLIIKNHTNIESIYIGGGTPTTLDDKQLEILINTISRSFNINTSEIEFTVEGGRPDTITKSKLHALSECGVSRISINPQTMKNRTLELIGRKHTSEDIETAYQLTSQFNFDVVNADLIAGLPEEGLDDFKNSLVKTIELGANNITIHTLSVKRGSKIKDNDPEYYRHNTEIVANMLKYAHEKLLEEGFYPYYIYRQKHQIGALENVGYCKPDKHSI